MKDCFCGGERSRKTHHRGDVPVTVYLECGRCGSVFIESDTTGHAMRKAYNKNRLLLQEMR